jgi:outer membrane protein assembly factor BamE (lipoprotein component of BamABCDE complex)
MAIILRESSLKLALENTSNQNELKGLEGEQKVLYEIGGVLSNTSTIIWNPNLLNYESDLLIIDENLGFIFVEVKHWSSQFIRRFHQNGTIETISGPMHPLKQTENYRSELKNYVDSFISRKVDVHQIISSIVVFPNLTSKEFNQRSEVRDWTTEAQYEFTKRHIFADELNGLLDFRLQRSRKFTEQISTVLNNKELQEVINSLSLEVLKEIKVESPIIEENQNIIPEYPRKKLHSVNERAADDINHRKGHSWLIASAVIFCSIIGLGFLDNLNDYTQSYNLPDEPYDYPNISYDDKINSQPNSQELMIPTFTEEDTKSKLKEGVDTVSKTETAINENSSQITVNVSIEGDQIYDNSTEVGQKDKISTGYITIGSSKENVKKILGNPSTIYDALNEWVYGYSSISFDSHDRVVGWDNSDNNLNVYVGEVKVGSTFSLGSTKETVISAMGTPTTIYDYLNSWVYGYSSIDFDINDRVVGWDNSENNLNVSLGNAKGGVLISLGSTKETVIAAMGTPTTIYASLNSWVYGYSSIDFNDNNRVVGWDNSDNNLKIK